MKRLLLLILLIMGTANGATNINSCTTLNTPGETYILTNTIWSSNTDDCIQIIADGITLDCQGNMIEGDGTAQRGIRVDACATTIYGLTIKNCVIQGWADDMIFITDMQDSSVYGLTISTFSASASSGIHLHSSAYNKLYDLDITVNQAVSGILVDWSDYNNISNTNISVPCFGGSYSMTLQNSADNNIIHDVRTSGNGVDFDIKAGCNNNLFYNNYFSIGSHNIVTGITGLKFNSTNQTGTRIYSAGTNIAGNYWSNPTSTGYSDTCNDTDQDGFCDDPYDLSVGTTTAWDYLPLSDEFVSDATPPNLTVHYPTPNVSTRDGTPTWNFTVVDDQSITLDCSLYIDGVVNVSNATVQNGTVSYLTPTGDLTLRWRTWTLNCSDSAGNSDAESSYIQIRNYRFLSAMSAVTICGFIFRARRGRRYR